MKQLFVQTKAILLLICLTCFLACSNENIENASTKTILVEGMTCEGCEQSIEMSVKELNGIGKIEASHIEQKVTVTFDTLLVSIPDIKEKITEAGYKVK